MILDTTAKMINIVFDEAHATTPCDVTAAYADITSTTYIDGGSRTTTTGTLPVTVVAPPAASTSRRVKQISLFNNDTIPHTVTVTLVDGAATLVIWKGPLAVGQLLLYSAETWNAGLIGGVGATGNLGGQGVQGRPGDDGADAINDDNRPPPPQPTPHSAVLPGEQYCALSANFTMTSSAAAQKALNATANGAVTLAGNTTYEFEAEYFITVATGNVSATFGVLFGGTASITSTIMHGFGSANPTSAAALTGVWAEGYSTTITSVLVLTPLIGTVGSFIKLRVRGRIRVNAGGTFIPQILTSLATTITPVMLANSFFDIWPVGLGTVTNVGNWS